MATIFDTLITRFAQDTVAVFTQDFTQIFPQARTIKAIIKEEAKVMEHPLENGSIVTDHRVILPVEIELSLLIPSSQAQDVYRTIRQYYLNGTLLIVQTKAGIYENQLISGMPHQEDSDQFGMITVGLKLKQVQFVTAKFGVVPKKASNSSTINRGTQQGTTVPPQSTAALDGARYLGFIHN